LIAVIITDATGRIVERRAGAAANSNLQVGGRLAPGVYFIEVSQGAQKQQFKVLKQ
jgi:hypothetical protein